jgi:tetratricopeptide (TPR) repeat protein
MVDQGIITTGVDKWQVGLDKLSDIVIPTTLSGVLQARLDRLPINERMLLQQASIVGRVFWDSIIYYMNELGFKDSERETIAAGLNDLHRKELIFRRELSAFAGSQEHIFKHAILREVTYESVVLRLRRKYHNLAADWLIEQSGERTGWHLGMIAEHLELAGRAGDAVEYLILAGQEAASTYANEEAINYFNRALMLVRDDELELRWTILLAREAVYHLQGKREAQKKDLDALSEVGANLYSGMLPAVLLVRQARYFSAIGDFPEAFNVSQKAIESASASQQPVLEAAAYFESSAALFTQEMYAEAGLRAQTCLEKAQEAGNRYIEGRVHNILGNIALSDYDLKSARTHYEKRIEIAREMNDRHGEGYGLGNLGLTYALEMDHETAQKYYKLNLAIDREIGDRDDESPCLSNLSESAYLLGEYTAALEYAEQALAIAQETGSPLNQVYSLDSLADALTILGELDEALTAYKQAISICKGIGQSSHIIRLQAGLARTYLAMEDLISAVDLADQILEYIDGGGILDHAEWPERVYETVIRVLEITGDPRLGETINSAYNLVQERSEMFSSQTSLNKYLYLEWNRKIISSWEQQQGLKVDS